jgi:hypothetical protein
MLLYFSRPTPAKRPSHWLSSPIHQKLREVKGLGFDIPREVLDHFLKRIGYSLSLNLLFEDRGILL